MASRMIASLHLLSRPPSPQHALAQAKPIVDPQRFAKESSDVVAGTNGLIRSVAEVAQ